MVSRRDVLAAGRTALAGMALHPRAYAAEGRVYVNRIALHDRRVVVGAMVRGQGPFLFLIDTGAAFGLIDEGFAKKLGLRRGRDIHVSGVGGGASLHGYVMDDMVLNGGIGLAEMQMSGFSDGRLGRDIVGSLGSGAMVLFDSEMDFERGEWRIHRDGPGDRAGYTRLDSDLTSGDPRTRTTAHIYARVSIDGKSYRLTVDTGTPGEISLFPRAVDRSGLWNDSVSWAPLRSSGVGGRTAIGRLVRAGKVEIADFTLERPVLYLRAPDGPVADESDGIIGLGVLRCLNLATDTASKTLWVKRNAIPYVPQGYGYSGLWVGGKEDSPVVEAVGAGSPAAAAGIRPGDRIQGIKLGLLIATLRLSPGAKFPMTLLRGGETIRTELIFRDYL